MRKRLFGDITLVRSLIFFFVLLTFGPLCLAQNDSTRFLEHEFVYSALPWYTVRGGYEQGFVYMDNVDITAKLNFDALFDWEQDLSLFLYGLGNHGGSASEMMGDFQVASNIEAPRTWRLFEAWIQQNFLNDEFSLLIGLYDLNSEFDVLRPGTIFINSSFGIGAEYAQSGINGPSIFPISSLGLRVSTTVANRIKLKLALLDGVSGDPNNPKSNRISISKSDGLLVAFESSIFHGETINTELDRGYVTRRKKVGREHDIPTNDKINIGGWVYTADFEPITNPNGNMQPERKLHPNWGVYAGVQKYWFLDRSEESYLAFFGRYGIANDQYNRLGSAISGGIVLSGFVTSRTDHLGLAFSSGINGQRYQQAFGQQEVTETVLEATYSIGFRHWLTIQPDVQYVVNPGTNPMLRNPLAFGLLLQVTI